MAYGFHLAATLIAELGALRILKIALGALHFVPSIAHSRIKLLSQPLQLLLRLAHPIILAHLSEH